MHKIVTSTPGIKVAHLNLRYDRNSSIMIIIWLQSPVIMSPLYRKRGGKEMNYQCLEKKIYRPNVLLFCMYICICIRTWESVSYKNEVFWFWLDLWLQGQISNSYMTAKKLRDMIDSYMYGLSTGNQYQYSVHASDRRLGNWKGMKIM